MIGYQYSTPDAFHPLSVNPSLTIDSYYVDGLSLTHGPPGAREHIWTFAAGLTETDSPAETACPCIGRQSLSLVPYYVGNDYFCESGNPGPSWTDILYASDPLWDGQGCASPPCCELSYPTGVTAPWFCKQLPQTTTDDLELRICTRVDGTEDTPVEFVELYIH